MKGGVEDKQVQRRGAEEWLGKIHHSQTATHTGQRLVNQNLRNRNMTEIKDAYLGFVRTAAQETQIKTHDSSLNHVPPNYKMQEVYKGKNCKVTVGQKSGLLRIIIGMGKKQGCLLSKDWLGSKMVA